MKKYSFLTLFILIQSLILVAQKAELTVPTGYSYGRAEFKIAPNNKYFVGADDKYLILWEAQSMRQLRTFKTESSKIFDFAISPDSKNIVVFTSADVQSFELESGKKLWSVKLCYAHYSGGYIENGNKITVIGNDDGYIISAQTGTKISEIKRFGAHEAKGFVLPNDNVVMLAKEFYRILDTRTNTLSPQTNFDGFKKRIAVAEKTGMAFVCSTGSEDIQIYDLKANKIIKTIKHSTQEPILGATTEGDLLTRSLDPENTQKLIVRKYAAPNFTEKKLTTSDMGGDYDGSIGGSSQADLVWGENGKVRKMSNGALVGDLAGQLLKYSTLGGDNSGFWQKTQVMGFYCDNNEYRLLDFKTGKVKTGVKTKDDEYARVSTFSSDGKRWAAYFSEGNTIRIYDVDNGKMLKSYPITQDLSDRLFQFSLNGESIYVHSMNEKFTVFDLKTGQLSEKFTTYPAPYYAFSADGKYVSALHGHPSGWKIGVWEIATGKELMNIPHKNEGYMRDFYLSTDGKLATVIDEGETAVYDVEKKMKIQTKPFTQYYGFAKGFWNFDNTKMAITGENRGVRIVDKSYTQTVETPSNGKYITKILFTEKGNVFLTVEHDQIGIFLTESGKRIGTYYAFKNSQDWLVVTPDGRYDGTPTAFKRLYYVKNTEVVALEALFEKFYTPNLYQLLLNGTPPTPIEDKDNINNLKPAPKVKIQYEVQQRNLTVDDDIPSYNNTTGKAKLTIKADCPEDGVAEIRLYHNGKLVGSGTRNLVVEDEVQVEKSKSQVFEIQLVEGENRFKAIALNTQRTESQPDEISVIYKTSKPSNTHNTEGGITLHLMVIGINKYKNPKYNLNYALADATSFKEAMEKGGSTIFSKTNVLFINDEKATKEGISAELEKIKTTANPKDVFIFYYAGHGVLSEKKEFFLVPHDVTQLYGNDDALAQKGLSSNQLQQFSKEIKAQKQLFILDACQSAGALEAVAMRGAAEEKAIAQLARATGTHWLTASGSEQFASEFAQLGHGTFTYVLLEALTGKADKGGDKKITVKELDAYLQEVVPEMTAKYKGTPQYPASYGFGNDFPIGVVKQ